jgi:hypothetical protein
MAVLDRRQEHVAAAADGARRRPAGTAPLLPPALAYVAVAVAGVVLPSALAGEAPWSSDAALLDFFGRHRDAARLSAFLVLASAVPFAVFTAIAAHRVRRIGMDVPGRYIALVGGSLAAALLALSGLSTLGLTRPGIAEGADGVRLLSGLAFATGGPGFVVFSGLLMAGISVPVLVGRLAPRWVGWLGLALAVACELATLTAVTPALDLLLPIGRFGGMVWLLGIAATLPTRAPRRSR